MFFHAPPTIFNNQGGEEDTFGSMELTKRITQDLEGNLHILSVQPEDDNDGKPYVCNAFNPTMRSIQQGDDQIVKIKVSDFCFSAMIIESCHGWPKSISFPNYLIS